MNMKMRNALIISVILIISGSIFINRYNTKSLPKRYSITKEYNHEKTPKEEKAERIVHAVTEIREIERASVILMEDTAIVAIVVDRENELDDMKLIELKKKASERARKADSSLEHVAVTAGAELVERIDEMADYKN